MHHPPSGSKTHIFHGYNRKSVIVGSISVCSCFQMPSFWEEEPIFKVV